MVAGETSDRHRMYELREADIVRAKRNFATNLRALPKEPLTLEQLVLRFDIREDEGLLTLMNQYAEWETTKATKSMPETYKLAEIKTREPDPRLTAEVIYKLTEEIKRRLATELSEKSGVDFITGRMISNIILTAIPDLSIEDIHSFIDNYLLKSGWKTKTTRIGRINRNVYYYQ